MAITHLIIDNGNYSVTVANKVVKNLYDLVKALYAAVPNHTADDCYIRGTISVEHAHPSRVEFLEQEFEDLTIKMTGDAYIDSDDPAAISRLASMGDGIGLTVIAAGTKPRVTQAFYQLNELEDASFFQFFTGLEESSAATERVFTSCSGLKSVTLPSNLKWIGNYAFYNCSSLTDITLPSTVSHIGQYAFSGSGLTSVTIPDSVTNIGTYVFSMCQNLASAVIGESLTNISDYMFSDCTSLTSVTIGSSVTTIGNYAFRNCSSLPSITIPSGVTSIGLGAFSGCTLLTTISIPDTVTEIGSDTFTNTAWYNNKPNGLIYIGKIAYKYKGTPPSNISITILDGTKIIAPSAFYSQGRIISVTIPNTVTSIGGSAFRGCSSLTSVTIPNSVTSIGGGAFLGCTQLESVTIPSSVTSIGNQAFFYCCGLTNISVESGNTVYDSRNNCNAIIETETNTLIYGSASTIIPNTVTSIADYAFYGFDKIETLIIPNSVTSIGYGTFATSSIKNVTIPGSVKSIPGSKYSNGNYLNGVFQMCKRLQSVIIEEGVERIEDGIDGSYGQSYRTFGAFRDARIVSLTIPSTMTYIGDYTADSCEVTNLHISDIAAWCNITFKDTRAVLFSSTTNLYLGENRITNLVIPSTVSAIKNYAFFNLRTITSVTFPNSLTSIGSYAFYNCTNLMSVTVKRATPVSIGSTVFSNQANATLYVPHGCATAYQAANYWKNFGQIVELPQE